MTLSDDDKDLENDNIEEQDGKIKK